MGVLLSLCLRVSLRELHSREADERCVRLVNVLAAGTRAWNLVGQLE